MMDEPAFKRRLILSSFAGALLAAFSVICLAGFGVIPPEPALGIVGFLSGAIILSTSTWRWARRHR